MQQPDLIPYLISIDKCLIINCNEDRFGFADRKIHLAIECSVEVFARALVEKSC
jgi:hypothetical protein